MVRTTPCGWSVWAIAALCLAATLAATGCSDDSSGEKPLVPPMTPIEPTDIQTPKPPVENPFQFDPATEYEVRITTGEGDLVLGFYNTETPKTVQRFLTLVKDHRAYEGLVFFRVIPDVLIQTGDPEGTGTGVPDGPGSLAGEFTRREFVAGTVGFARREDMPDSGDMQWFICLDRRADWDGKFAAFAYVKEGLDVARKISRGETEGTRAVHWSRRQRPVKPVEILKAEIVKPAAGSASADSQKRSEEAGD
jgi:peptidyl-prolyl cis-trans isomerase B (cyclophilin B)